MYDRFKLQKYYLIYLSYEGALIRKGFDTEEELNKYLKTEEEKYKKHLKVYQLKE